MSHIPLCKTIAANRSTSNSYHLIHPSLARRWPILRRSIDHRGSVNQMARLRKRTSSIIICASCKYKMVCNHMARICRYNYDTGIHSIALSPYQPVNMACAYPAARCS
jgi:hypothetical protein